MPLSETQHRTLMHVAQSEKYSGPGSTSNRGAVWMANQSGRSVPRVERTLDSLEAVGLVERDDAGPQLTERGRTVLAESPDAVDFESDPAAIEQELLAELESGDDEPAGGILEAIASLFR